MLIGPASADLEALSAEPKGKAGSRRENRKASTLGLQDLIWPDAT